MTSPAITPSTFPLQLDFTAPDKVQRWRPLLNWLLAIPHIVILYVLSFVSEIVFVISWFAILFTGKMPEGLFGFQVMAFRYRWRVTTFILFMRDDYPPFEFTTGGADPGTDLARLSIQPAAKLSRGLIFIKWLLVIPNLLVLMILAIGVYIAIIIGFFAVLITGSWPEGLRNYVVGVMRWSMRTSAYIFLLTDQYPPFSLS